MNLEKKPMVPTAFYRVGENILGVWFRRRRRIIHKTNENKEYYSLPDRSNGFGK